MSRVGEERKSISLHCTPGVDSSNSLAKATVGEYFSLESSAGGGEGFG